MSDETCTCTEHPAPEIESDFSGEPAVLEIDPDCPVHAKDLALLDIIYGGKIIEFLNRNRDS